MFLGLRIAIPLPSRPISICPLRATWRACILMFSVLSTCLNAFSPLPFTKSPYEYVPMNMHPCSSSHIAIALIFNSSLLKYECRFLSFNVTTPLSSVITHNVLSLDSNTFLMLIRSLRSITVWASFLPVVAYSPLPDVAITIVPSFLSARQLTKDITDSPSELMSATFSNLSLVYVCTPLCVPIYNTLLRLCLTVLI